MHIRLILAPKKEALKTLVSILIKNRSDKMLKVELRKTEDLIEYDGNPRNNERAVEPVMNSIKEFGFLAPVLIDSNDIIIAGHTRKEAAVRLGLKEIPCITVDSLTDEQVKAFRLVDNKTAEFASWDFEKLEEELSNIINIDLSAYKFPDLRDIELDVSDADFLQDTEIVKNSKAKTATCPSCGEVFEI